MLLIPSFNSFQRDRFASTLSAVTVGSCYPNSPQQEQRVVRSLSLSWPSTQYQPPSCLTHALHPDLPIDAQGGFAGKGSTVAQCAVHDSLWRFPPLGASNPVFTLAGISIRPAYPPQGLICGIHRQWEDKHPSDWNSSPMASTPSTPPCNTLHSMQFLI